jgi:hypothetical protein
MLIKLRLGRNHATRATQQQTHKQALQSGAYWNEYPHPVNKFVSSDPNPKAIAKKIRRLNRGNGKLNWILQRIISCHEKAKHWEDLSPTQRIMLELEWTDSTDGLLSIGNMNVMHSIRYRLREQTPEEDYEMELKQAVEEELKLPWGAEKRSDPNAAYQGEQNDSTNPRT